jgi:small-conductance mechanosensitive channel
MIMILEDIYNIFQTLSFDVSRITISLIFLVLSALIYKILSRFLSRIGKRLDFEPHLENSLRLVLRVVTLSVVAAVLLSIHELPTTWFVGASAILGAAIGFGSSQTINNIVAGFYVLISKPFKVKDYVKIDDLEGQVEEISINYTKLYTPSFNLLLVPNIQVMNSRILNCTHEDNIKYTFSFDLPHSVPISNEEIVKYCIEPAIEEFHKKHYSLQLRKPEYYFKSSENFGRSFKIRIFIPKGEAKTLYVLQPELSYTIINRWDSQRKNIPK